MGMRAGVRGLLLGFPPGAAQVSAGVKLPFADDFARANGDLGNGWEYTPGVWTIASGRAVATPGANEIIANGNMETGDPPTAWTATNATLSASAERTGGAGAQSLSVANSGANYGRAEQAITPKLSVDTWARFSGYTKKGTSAQAALRVYDKFSTLMYQLLDSTGNWVTGAANLRFVHGEPTIHGANNSNTDGQTSLFDDLSLKALTTADLFAVQYFSNSNVNVGVEAIIGTNSMAGVVCALDSIDAPANYLLAYYDRLNNKAVLNKVLNGVHQNLLNVSTSYAAGAIVMIKKNGTTVQLFYNGSQRGADQTVSDAAIVDNKRHGMFSVDAGNTLDDFSVTDFS